MNTFILYITLTFAGNITINTTMYTDRQSCINGISKLKNTDKELRTNATFTCIKQRS